MTGWRNGDMTSLPTWFTLEQPDDPGHAQRAVTPGQAVVLYDGDTVLGGGTIL